MPRFAKFEQYDGKRIYVNVDAIMDVYEDEVGGEQVRLDLIGDADNWYIVKGTYERVTGIIREALS